MENHDILSLEIYDVLFHYLYEILLPNCPATLLNITSVSLCRFTKNLCLVLIFSWVNLTPLYNPEQFLDFVNSLVLCKVLFLLFLKLALPTSVHLASLDA